MEDKVRGNFDNKNKGYHQNYSFRVSWCRDGFASLGINKCGSYQIDINKVIIYEEFYKNSQGNFEEYQNIVKDYNKSFSILFKALSEKYDLESVEKNIENLSFVENNENRANLNKYSWPEKQQFMKRIFLYMFKYSKVLNLQKDHLFHEKFYQDEIFNLGLMNILFGNPKIDINRFFKFLRNDSSDEKYFNTLYDTFDKCSQNNANEEYQRKILLNKWLEGKAANVIFSLNSNEFIYLDFQSVLTELNVFRQRNNEIGNEKERIRYFQEIVKIYLSGNQIYEAAEFVRTAGYPKLSLGLVQNK